MSAGDVASMGMFSQAQRAALTQGLRSGRSVRLAGPVSGTGRIVELTGTGDRPFFLVHAIGGTVSGYVALAKELASAYRVYGIQASGPDSQPADLDAMVSSYVADLRSVQPSGPYRLGGWSMGGMVAYEVARRLEAAGERVALLGLLDSPSHMPPAPEVTQARFTAFFVGETARTLGWGAEVAAVESATDTDHLGWLIGRLAAGGVDRRIVKAEIERRVTMFRGHHRIISGYCPSGRLPAACLIAETSGSANWAAEWARLIDGPVQRVHVPGNHYTVLNPPSARLIAEFLRGHVTS